MRGWREFLCVCSSYGISLAYLLQGCRRVPLKALSIKASHCLLSRAHHTPHTALCTHISPLVLSWDCTGTTAPIFKRDDVSSFRIQSSSVLYGHGPVSESGFTMQYCAHVKTEKIYLQLWSKNRGKSLNPNK